MRWGPGGIDFFISSTNAVYSPYTLSLKMSDVADPSNDQDVEAMDTAGDSPDDQKDQTTSDTGGKGQP